MRTVQVAPIIVGLVGSVTKNLNSWLGKLNWYFITPENYVFRNSKIFEESIKAVE